MNKATLFKTLPFVLILASCAVTPGMKEADVPPKIVKVDNQLTWNDPSAFGPVPQDKAASGNTICQSMGFASATGYHRSAQDINGKPFPNGGYFCEGKSEKASLTFPPSIAAPVAATAAMAPAPSAMPMNSAAPQAMPPAKTQATDTKKKKKTTNKSSTAKPASPAPAPAPGASTQ
jgi:hypothetical protein